MGDPLLRAPLSPATVAGQETLSWALHVALLGVIGEHRRRGLDHRRTLAALRGHSQ